MYKYATLSLILTLIFYSITLAQNSFYDLRFLEHDIDCDSTAFYVDIEIKANLQGGSFNLGDQNYRFSFNRRALANPTISEELTISGFVMQGATSSFYGPHSLTGSIDTVISYNMELSGGNGYPVNTQDWVSIGRVRFDIINFNTCINLWFHTQDTTDFPPTFISANDPIIGLYALEEGLYNNYNQCLLSICTSPPIANYDTIITYANQNGFVNILSNDTDADNDINANSIQILQAPNNGHLRIDYTTGVVTYRPNSNFHGNDQFIYLICDSYNQCDSTIVSIQVNQLLGSLEFISDEFYSIYPNPTKEYVYLQVGSVVPQKIELIDTKGHIILTQPIKSFQKHYQISLGHISAGLYYLRLSFLNKELILPLNKQ